MTRSTNNSMAADDDDVQPLLLPQSVIRAPSSESARRPPATSTAPRKALPTLAPAPAPASSGQASLSSPPASPTAPRRGRKPSSAGQTISRSAREAARKSNHSRIEKLRREKINDALQSLKDLVPVDESVTVEKKTAGGEKEFKLEILERTVVYLRKLKARVQELEEGTNVSGVGPVAPQVDAISSSRSVGGDTIMSSEDGEDDIDKASDGPEDEDEIPAEIEEDVDRHPAPPTRTNSSTSIRLPPISSLFQEHSNYTPYLSPPHSGRSQPWQPVAPPPSLRLPPSTAGTPVEEAASALIQFSAERTSLSPTETRMRKTSLIGGDYQTPASILGMGHLVPEVRTKKQRLM